MIQIDIPFYEVGGVMFSEIVSGFPKNGYADPADPMVGSGNDMERLSKLSRAKGASGHDCALKGIGVKLVIKAPQYWWLQAERYHWFDIVSSQSKMHMITDMDLEAMVNEWVEQDTIDRLREAILLYNEWFDTDVDTIPSSQLIFPSRKHLRQYIMSNVPMGFYHSAGITTNYLQLKTMYNQRRTHDLFEWQEFCDWVEELPHSHLITGKKES